VYVSPRIPIRLVPLDDPRNDILLNAEDDMILCPYPDLVGLVATALLIPFVALLVPIITPLGICAGCALAFIWIYRKIYGKGSELLRRAWHWLWYVVTGM
jgi:hypothetical protein